MISEMKKRRLIKGLTLDDIYLRSGIDISRLSRIERGIFQPSQREMKLISKALRVRQKDIFTEN
jgi:transcriptional regulator with XRE-family HTH domain